MLGRKNSPYLKEGRLALVIAAIQSLGNRGWGSARIPEFVRNIEGIEDLTLGRARVEPSRASIDTWAELFRELPNFSSCILWARM
jgi:hypothetical protein